MPQFEYAPWHRIKPIILASADGDGDGWEKWRRESVDGPWWYRRRIEGVADDEIEAEFIEDEIDPDELAEVEAMEAETEFMIQDSRDRLENLRAEREVSTNENDHDDFID